LQFCRAQDEIQVPPTLTFALGSDASTDNKLWDLTGNYDLNLTVVDHNGLSVPVAISFFLNQDANGRLSTPRDNFTGLVFSDADHSAFAILCTVRGKVTGSDGLGRAHFTVRFSGNGSFGGVQNVRVSGSVNVDAEVDASTGELSSTRATRFVANISGVNSVRGTSDFTTPLPSGVDGTWNLTLNLAGLQRLTGTGVFATQNNAFGLNLRGRFDGTNVRLRARGSAGVPGTRSGRGSNANISLPSDFSTVTVNGRLLGQKVTLNVPVDTGTDTGTNTPPVDVPPVDDTPPPQ